MVRALSVEALASASGETIETILLCEREGLLGEPVWKGSVRRYHPHALAVLRLVRLGQWLGVEFDTIRAAIPALDDPSRLRSVLRGWAKARLVRLAREQKELRRAQRVLDEFLARSAAGEAAEAGRVGRDIARLERDLARQRGPEALPRWTDGKPEMPILRRRRLRTRVAASPTRRETSQPIGL